MGTIITNSVCGRSGAGLFAVPGSVQYYGDDDGHPLCIICAAIFCFTFAMTIFFSLKQEAVLGKCIIILIIVLSIILLCAACRKSEKKTLPVQPSRIQCGTGNVVKKENKTLHVQPRRVGFGIANVLAFFKKIKLFVFSKNSKTPNSYYLESEMATKIQPSLPVATYDNTILV